MSVVEPVIGSSSPSSDTVGEEPTLAASPPRLSLLRWLGLILVRPVKAVRGSDHFGWLGSWAVHLLGLLLGVVAAVAHPLVFGHPSSFGVGPPLTATGMAILDGVETAAQNSESMIVAGVSILAMLLTAHVMAVVAAVALMCWTARSDERARTSWARALQRLWRLTPFAAVMVVVLSLGAHLVELVATKWFTWRYWELEMYLWSVVWLVSVAWPTVVTLWALHPGPTWPHCRWPAGCAGCGYALLGLGERQTCPECGLAVEQSTDATARPGLAWGHWRNLFNWWRNGMSAIRQPTRVGQSLHLIAPDEQHRRRFGQQLAAAVLSPVPGILTMMAILAWVFDQPVGDDLLPMLVVMTLILGTWTMVIMAGIQLAGAGLLGGLASWHNGRNMLPAARQGMVCLGGYMLLWVALVWIYWLTVVTGIYIIEEYLSIGGSRWSSLGLLGLMWLVFLGLNLAMGVGYLALLGRIVRGARYANW